MTNQIALTRYAMPVIALHRHVWTLKVVAVSSIEGIPNEIFVYHIGTSNIPDRFEAVSSVANLSMYGTLPQSVGTDSQIPFYRSDTATHDCLSESDMEDLWQRIQDDVAELIANFNAKMAMTPAETVTLP